MVIPISIHELEFPEGKLPELRISSWADAAYTLAVRGFTKRGAFQLIHTTNSNRTLKQDRRRLEDYPLRIVVSAPTCPPRHGQCFVTLELIVAGFFAYSLGHGYVSYGKALSWPPGDHKHSLEGPGNIKLVTGTNPPAGSEISETVPTNARWQILGMRIRLVTDATVVSRRVCIILDDGATVFNVIRATQTQPESIAYNYSLVPGLGFEDTIGISDILIPLPVNLILPQGYRIRTSTINLQAGDNFDAPKMFVMEWLQE